MCQSPAAVLRAIMCWGYFWSVNDWLVVFQVQDSSPGQSAGLEPFFDYIVAIGNTRLVGSVFLFSTVQFSRAFRTETMMPSKRYSNNTSTNRWNWPSTTGWKVKNYGVKWLFLDKIGLDHLSIQLDFVEAFFCIFSKTQTVRQTQIVPSQSWGGQGLLGVSIRFCSFEGANQNVWHIVAVQPNSPADQAGLQSNTDYVLGEQKQSGVREACPIRETSCW